MLANSENYVVHQKPPPSNRNGMVRTRRRAPDQDRIASKPTKPAHLKRHSSHSKLIGSDTNNQLFAHIQESEYSLRKSTSLSNIDSLSVEEACRTLSASNLLAVSDPNLSLKGAVPKKSYNEPHTSYAKEKAKFTAWTQKYYHQLTVGCGNKTCLNRFCKSSPKCLAKSDAIAAVFSIELAPYESRHLCHKEKQLQQAKVLPDNIFDEKEERKCKTRSSEAMPFLHMLYKMSPFRSLFLPCPLISSKQGLTSRAHSLGNLHDQQSSDGNAGIASAISSQLSRLTSTLSSSLSNLWSASNSECATPAELDTQPNNTTNNVLSEAVNDLRLSDSRESEECDIGRTRQPSFRLFGPEFAVDNLCTSQAELDAFESEVAAEMEEAKVEDNEDFYEEYDDADNVDGYVDGESSPRSLDSMQKGIEHGFSLTHLSLTMFRTVMNNYSECGDDSFLQNTLRTVFSSWSSLSMSFSDESTRQHSKYPFSLKLTDVEEMFVTLRRVENFGALLNLLNDVILLLLAEMQENCSDMKPSDLKPLLIILQLPDLPENHSIMQEIASFMANLPEECTEVLLTYFSDRSVAQLAQIVKGFQRLLSLTTSWQTPCLTNPEMVPLCKALQIVYMANSYHIGQPVIIPPSSFYCSELASKLDVKQEYLLWKTQYLRGRSSHESVLNYPFLLDPAIKVQVIHIDAVTQMREEYQNAIVHQARVQQVSKSWGDFTDSSTLSNEVRSALCPYLVLEVRREHLIEDTLQQVRDKSDDLKKPLKIKYVAGGEQGLDMGGLQKEFFQIIIETVFDQDYGMFSSSEDKTLVWFNAQSLESQTMFELVGILLGLAIYNGIILDIHFPLVLYQKLLGQDTVSLADLEQMEPTLKASLEQVLSYEGDLEGDLGMNFEVLVNSFNSTQYVELIPNGADVPVNESNRDQFVALYVDYLFNKSIDRQFKAFQRGFFKVCSNQALRLFTPPELELLICGNPELDLRALEQATDYRDGYSRTHPLILEFWQIVHEMDMKQLRALLMFVTGSYRVPLKGLGSLKIVIQRNGPDSNLLPTAMTCFNRLLLPEYKSAEKLKNRLLLAIQNAKGFGLS